MQIKNAQSRCPRPLLAVLVTVSLCASPARAADPVPAPAQFEKAVSIIKEIAKDDKQLEANRLNAITACTRLFVKHGQYDRAIAFCRELLDADCPPPLAATAFRMAAFATRNRDGHLGGVATAIAHEKHAPVSSKLMTEIAGVRGKIKATFRRHPIAAPVRPATPTWLTATDGNPPKALVTTKVTISAPAWYAKATFPPPRHGITTPSWYGKVTFPPLKK